MFDAYESYVEYCNQIGVEPAPEELWQQHLQYLRPTYTNQTRTKVSRDLPDGSKPRRRAQ